MSGWFTVSTPPKERMEKSFVGIAAISCMISCEITILIAG